MQLLKKTSFPTKLKQTEINPKPTTTLNINKITRKTRPKIKKKKRNPYKERFARYNCGVTLATPSSTRRPVR